MQPFLKWTGGKRQLLDSLKERLPQELKNKEIDRVSANRNINCKGDGREAIDELLIANYDFAKVTISHCP